MIRLQYHPELIEQAVRLAVRDDDARQNELHQAIDPIYQIEDAAERETRFGQAFVEWFRRLRLDRFIDESLANFPNLVEGVTEGFVRPAARRKSQRADLFVRPDSDAQYRTLVIQLCPESVVEPAGIRDALMRELQHVEDMVDPSFGYAPEAIAGFPSQQQLARDRYCVLWDIRIERILESQGLIERCQRLRLAQTFRRAFTVGGRPPAPDVFERLWEGETASHVDILCKAGGSLDWVGDSTQVSECCTTNSSGSLCPMCGFPTYDWFELDASADAWFDGRVRERIGEWRPTDGICRQCAETILSERTRFGPNRGTETVGSIG